MVSTTDNKASKGQARDKTKTQVKPGKQKNFPMTRIRLSNTE